jgi:hypothetical protein
MATLTELLDQVSKFNWGQSRAALTKVTETITKAHGDKVQLANIEKALLEVLESDATTAGKQFVCGQLCLIGTEQSIPTLAKMLTDEQTSDMTRYALERIPGPEADAALRNALQKTSGKLKTGIINSLGQRRDKEAAATLGELINDSDPMISSAAANALGQIADSQAVKILAQAKDKTTGKLQMQVLDSYLLCADLLAADGQKAEALGIYKELQQQQMPQPIRAAALRGTVNTMKR